MSSTLTPDGWVVENDIVDERNPLPRLTQTQIDALNARIAAGSNEFPAGTQVVRVSDETVFQKEGVGTAGAFVPVGSSAVRSLADAAGDTDHVIQMDHNGEGYGINILNRPGAKPAFVVHQYSNDDAAVILDNTDTAPLVRMNNTANPTNNPGGPNPATGDFIQWQTSGITKLRLNKDYVFEGSSGTSPSFKNAAGTGYALQILGVSTNTTGALRVLNDGSGSAIAVDNSAAVEAVKITQGGAQRALQITQNGANLGVDITANAGSAGFYPLKINGYNYGPAFTTSQDSGLSCYVEKNGTGAGEALRITNKGTGLSLEVRTAATQVFGVTAAGLPKWAAAANVQTTVGAAGAASALPATPSKYLKIVGDDGVTYVVPAYAAA